MNKTIQTICSWKVMLQKKIQDGTACPGFNDFEGHLDDSYIHWILLFSLSLKQRHKLFSSRFVN